MNPRRLLLYAVVAVAAVLAGGLGLWAGGAFADREAPSAGAPTPVANIGGPFSLIDQNGRPFTQANLAGRPTAYFFGFTSCPEICPTTLSELSGDLAALGPAADRLNVVFVSVDPQRDTPEQLRRYLSSFDRRIVAVTGSEQQVAAMTRAYRIYSRRVPTEGGGYTMDHDPSIYLYDGRGRLVEPVGYGDTPERRRAALRRLVG